MLNVPQYEGLSIETILEKGEENPQVAKYLPDERDLPRLPRSFIVNVTYTLLGDSFKTWVHKRIKERNDKIAENQKLIIELDAPIAHAFKRSVNISSKFHLSRPSHLSRCAHPYFICSE